MTDCPGYLSVIINDRTGAEQLFHCDVMMPCPSRFNLTFTIPRTPTSHSSQVQTFEVILDDAKRPYQLLLTYFRSFGGAGNDGNAETGVAAEAYSSKVIQGHTTNVTKVFTACVMTVVICLSVRLLCDVTVLRREKPSITEEDHNDVITGGDVTGFTIADSGGQRRHLVCISLYVGFHVVYCLLITFTAMSAIFLVHFRSEIDHVTNGRKLLGNLTRRAISGVEQVSARVLETELELAERRSQRLSLACSRHVDDMTLAVQQSILNITLRHQRRNSTSVSSAMSAIINSTLADVERWMWTYVDELDKQFERRTKPVLVGETRFHRQIANSDWLLYARSLFNRSIALASLTASSSSPAAARTAGAVVRFLRTTLSVDIASDRQWYKPARLQRSVVTQHPHFCCDAFVSS